MRQIWIEILLRPSRAEHGENKVNIVAADAFSARAIDHAKSKKCLTVNSQAPANVWVRDQHRGCQCAGAKQFKRRAIRIHNADKKFIVLD